jgi:TRAP transporter TAXI family solute receptor
MEQMTGMKIRVTPEENTSTKQKLLSQGAYLLDADGVTVFADGIEASSAYATNEGGPCQIRVVWNMMTASLGLMVTADSPIKTIYDIKPGMKMPSVPSQPATEQSYDAFLAWANLSRKDMKLVPFGDWPSSCKALIDKSVDFAYGSTAASYALEIAAGPHGLRWIELDPNKDPEGAKRFLAVKKTTSFGPAKSGVASALDVCMLSTSAVLATRAESDTELIYHIAKWLDENYNAYKDKDPSNIFMNLDAMREYCNFTFLPIHDGTIKYLKEKGMWTAADDARQQKNIALIAEYTEAYKAAIADANKKGIKIDPMNKDWINLWNEYKKDIPSVKVEL